MSRGPFKIQILSAESDQNKTTKTRKTLESKALRLPFILISSILKGQDLLVNPKDIIDSFSQTICQTVVLRATYKVHENI